MDLKETTDKVIKYKLKYSAQELEDKLDKVDQEYSLEEKEKLNGLKNYDDSQIKSDVNTLTENKLDKNQGIENSGKVLGTNANGEVIPLNGYGFEYDEETKMLKYGTDPTSNLNQGIGLDDTLSKRGYAADAGAVGELKEDLSDIKDNTNLIAFQEKTTTVGGVSVSTTRNGNIELSGTATIDGGRLNKICNPFTLPAGTYTISSDVTNLIIEDNATNAVISFASVKGNTFTLDNDTAVYFSVNLVKGRTYSISGNVMLNVGSYMPFIPTTTAKDVFARAIFEENSGLIKDITQCIYPDIEMISGKYITQYGSEAELSVYKCTDYIPCNIRIAVRTNVVNDLSRTAFYDKDKHFISAYNASSENKTLTELTVPDGAAFVRISCLTAYNDFKISYYDFISSLSNVIANSSDTPVTPVTADSVYGVLQMFDNITCCGDSLTYSQVYTGASGSRQAHVTYPEALEKITGTSVTAYASAGYDSINWWNAYESNIVSKDNQCAIIYLGTNHGFTDTLDTDAPTGTDYTTWADTTTGCLAKMVAKFQSVGARVILVKCYATSGDSLSVTNSVIKAVADRFHCGLVENSKLSDNAYHYYPDLSGVNPIHYNDIGYSAFANYLNSQIANMDKNYLKFIIPE